MWNLLRFLVKYASLFTWLILTIISILLLCYNNPYHRSAWLGSSNIVIGSFYETMYNVNGYFGLRKANEELLSRIETLEKENLFLRKHIREEQEELAHANDSTTIYSYKIAHVISNSIFGADNYITIDKGSKDGIVIDQGVANHQGVIGIVSKVTEHYSLVLSLLNSKFRLSASLKNSDSFGSLFWDGKSPHYALLEDLPRTVKFEKGDTIVTTSYSVSFPENVPVGIVEESFDQSDNISFRTIKVKLFPDFNSLSIVHVIANEDSEERNELFK
mgnify:FL=1